MDEQKVKETLISWRHTLHAHPETAFEEVETARFVADKLRAMGCTVHEGIGGTGVVADLTVGDGKKVIGLRADMDAINVKEVGTPTYQSQNPGKMHACGHDAHMAMALTAAVYVDCVLRERPGELGRNVLFVFQPAEETTGGAKTVCESGVFERYHVDRIFGFHVWPDLPAGTVASCAGPMLARASETHVRIHGESIHIAKTLGVHEAESHDAALAAARFLVAERELMDRLGAEEPCICKFGLVEAGTVCNVVAGEAHLAGSLRVFTDSMLDVRARAVRCALEEAVWPTYGLHLRSRFC